LFAYLFAARVFRYSYCQLGLRDKRNDSEMGEWRK